MPLKDSDIFFRTPSRSQSSRYASLHHTKNSELSQTTCSHASSGAPGTNRIAHSYGSCSSSTRMSAGSSVDGSRTLTADSSGGNNSKQAEGSYHPLQSGSPGRLDCLWRHTAHHRMRRSHASVRTLQESPPHEQTYPHLDVVSRQLPADSRVRQERCLRVTSTEVHIPTKKKKILKKNVLRQSDRRLLHGSPRVYPGFIPGTQRRMGYSSLQVS